MNLLSQLFVLRASAASAGSAGSAGGFVFALIIALSPMLFLEPYYNELIEQIHLFTGIKSFNSIIPVSVMIVALIGGIGPIFVLVSGSSQSVLFVILKWIISIPIILASAVLFLFGFIHWLFFSSGFNV